MEEVWKDTICHSKEIWVSNMGNIKDENLNDKHQNQSYRYNRFCIGKHREMTHIWVAFMFCPNPDSKTIVHHINGNRRDNRAENLMWCTPEEHVAIHGRHSGVCQISADGKGVIATFRTAREAGKAMGGSTHTAISLCCSGKRKTAYGYRCRWAE